MLSPVLCTTLLSICSSSSLLQEVKSNFGESLVVLGDINKDGVDDFVVCDPWLLGPKDEPGWLVAVCGRERNIIWEVWGWSEAGRSGGALFALGDVDGDGIEDLADSGATPLLQVRSGATGKRLFRVPGGSASSAGDVDEDGHDDLLVAWPGVGRFAVEQGEPVPPLAIRSGVTGEMLPPLTLLVADTVNGLRAGAVGDVDGDGRPDWGVQLDGLLSVYHAPDGEPMPLPACDNLLSLAHPRSKTGSPVVAAVKGPEMHPRRRSRWDGRIHLLFFDAEQQLSDGAQQPIRTAEVRPKSDMASPFGLFVESLGDVNEDGVEDYLLGVDSALFWYHVPVGVWSGAGADMLWSYPVPDEICSTSVAGVGDLDGDGVRDVLVTGSWSIGGPPVEGWVEGLSGKTGKRIFKLTRDDLSPPK